MSTRSVRLDDEAEQRLRELQDRTDLTVSEILRRGIDALYEQLEERESESPYEIYEQLDLGPGGYARAPSDDYREGVRRAIDEKLEGDEE